jgi:hypothetical protein
MKTEKVQIYQNGIIGLNQYGRRSDGMWFTRCQSKTIHGYRWGAWRELVRSDELPSTVEPYHLTEKTGRVPASN